MSTNAEKVLELARKKGVLRSRDHQDRAIPRVILTRLERAGKIERVVSPLPKSITIVEGKLVE